MTTSDPAGCGRFRELAPEIALGLVAGHERAAALAHLQDCADCRHHTARLGAVHDRLRALIPPAEPGRASIVPYTEISRARRSASSSGCWSGSG